MNIDATDYSLPQEVVENCSVGGCGSRAVTLTALRDIAVADDSYDFEIYLCDFHASELGVQLPRVSRDAANRLGEALG